MANRLIQVDIDGTAVFVAAYDARTRRLSKIEGTDTTTFRYNGGTSFQEFKNGDLSVEFVRGLGMGGGIGSILYRDTFNPDGTIKATESFHYNAVGHVVANTDATGVVTQTNAYDALGQVVAADGSSDNNRLANTKERDASIGLDNHGFRYYDPATGRYITRDPIGYADGLNVYAHVHNNPINHVDPLGLETGEGERNSDSILENLKWEFRASIRGYKNFVDSTHELVDTWNPITGDPHKQDAIISDLSNQVRQEAQWATNDPAGYGQAVVDSTLEQARTLATSTEAQSEFVTGVGLGAIGGRLTQATRAIDGVQTNGRAAVGRSGSPEGPGTASTIADRKLYGDAASDRIATETGGIREGSFQTVGGTRYVDVVDLGDTVTAIESKTGRIGLGGPHSDIRQQLARDFWLQRQGQVDQVRWEFSPSPTTGLIGPRPALQDKLNKLGFESIIRQEDP